MLAVLAVLFFAPRGAWAQASTPGGPPPLTVDADEIVYDDTAKTVEARGHVRLAYRGVRVSADRVVFDLSAERFTAEGHVVLVDARGREVRGQRIIYDVRLEMADVQQAEAVVDGVFVRSERLVAQPGRVQAIESMATTCNPANPPYRVTAASIELIPGERLTARRATLWLGRFRVLSLPVLTLSLGEGEGEETSRSLPRVGYSQIDGLWADYLYRPGAGTRGFYVLPRLGTLAQRFEVGIDGTYALGVAASANVRAGAGWHRETGLNVSTSKVFYEMALRMNAPQPLGARTIWRGAVSFGDAWYGTGDRQSVLRANAALTHRLNEPWSVELSYDLVDVRGITPLAYDAVALDDRIHRAALQVVRTGGRDGGMILTRAAVGASYNFRDATPSAILAYGERIPDRYHWSLGTEYNLTTHAVKVSADLGRRVGANTYVTVQGAYDTAAQRFTDLDLLISTRLCECFDLSLVYRSVRRELWITIALAPVLQRRGSP